ncbi:MAG: TRAP transporter substrate-binding protein [Polaromonas sp.]|nr:TRAP transporter substrate-binding protein [Polaromonas sp.]
MNKLKISIIAVILMSAASIAMADAPKRFDFASAYPENSLISQAVVDFANNVKVHSQGKILISTHFGGALGYDSRSQYAAAEQGAVDLAQYPMDNLLGLDPMYELHSLPFISPSIKDSYELYKIALPFHEKAFNKANQTILFSAPFTPQGIWSKAPIRTIEDLKGLKLRTVEAVSTSVFNKVGATPIQLAWGEVLPALGTSAISGMVTSDESGVNAQVWDFGVKYFMPLGYSLGIGVTTMNLDSFERLTADEKNMLRKQGKAVEAVAWKRSEDRVAKNRAQLESKGGKFVEDINPTLMTALKAAGAPFVEAWKNKIGADISGPIFKQYSDIVKKD